MLLWKCGNIFDKKFGTFLSLSYFYKLEIKDCGNESLP